MLPISGLGRTSVAWSHNVLDCAKVDRMANRLAHATSPYLLQHQHNPVDWREWGDEAFAEARRRDVPVILSVGYAACHWCQVTVNPRPNAA